MDRISPDKRKWNMSRIKNRNTSPELAVRKFLWSKGFRYKLNVKNMPGKPDIVLPRYHTVIFVNGCFWHGHSGCKNFTMPETRSDFWKNKIEGTIKRDKDCRKKLKEQYWKVITIWECELSKKNITKTLYNLELSLSKENSAIG